MPLLSSLATLLSSLVDPRILLGIGLAALFSTLVLAVPLFQREKGLAWFSLVAAIVFYWKDFLGFVLVTGCFYLIVRWLMSQTQRSRRWNLALLSILALAILFTVARLEHWDRPIAVGSAPIVVFSLGMWPALRLVTLLWEVGSGAVSPSLTQYVIWSCIPLT